MSIVGIYGVILLCVLKRYCLCLYPPGAIHSSSTKDMTLIFFYKSAKLRLSPTVYILKLLAFLKGCERLRIANRRQFKAHRRSCISVQSQLKIDRNMHTGSRLAVQTFRHYMRDHNL
jgi:hypothetical protein